MRLRLSAAVSLALFAALALPDAARAQATGSVTGTVVDSTTQRPLQQVRVGIAGVRESYTRDDGTFTLANIPAGAHRVRVNLIGYGPGERTVTVASGQAATVR
ncbi:MAG TPA: carboxypeptidase regulatory-like domain-containing protein, partial [Gemmatimonadaceae bacterium]|nr:carboxypeptidase regulatory-like domain-containing protein [Gemmatimonadaceae bacterium]